MSWKYYDDFPSVSDREAGLYMKQSNQGRDDFRYYLKQISDDRTVLCFEYKAVDGRRLTEEEKSAHPGLDYLIVYHVVERIFGGTLSDAQKAMIESALPVWANGTGGYAVYESGVGKRALVDIKYVSHLEGY